MCDICVENFNKSTRKPVTCEFCEFVCCRVCVERYVLDEQVVRCMMPSCGKAWSKKHIRKVFQLKFIKEELAEHHGELLFQREQALFPETQVEIERRESIEKERIQLLSHIKELRELANVELSVLQKKYPISERRGIAFENYKNEMDVLVRPLWDQANEYERQLRELGNQIYNNVDEKRKPKFVKACPSEDCRGFLNEQFGCGLCKTQFCDKCHGKMEEDQQHVCNEDDVATVSFMSRDTKPCPKCGEGIFKIDGCDQMWCPSCHTAFSLRTGNIETNIHNPHYYEYMRKTGGGQAPRNPGDVPCGRVLDHNLTTRFYEEIERIKGHVNIPPHNMERRLYNEIARKATIEFFKLIPEDEYFICPSDFAPYILKAIRKFHIPIFDNFPIKEHLERLCFGTLTDMIKTYPIKCSDIWDNYQTHIMSAEKKINWLDVKMTNITRGGIHTMAHMPHHENWTENRFYYLRSCYLLQNISKEIFVDELLKDNIRIQFNNEIHDLLSMGTDMLRDILYRYLDTLTHIHNLNFVDTHPEIDVLPEIQRLVHYVNDNLYEICRAYSKPVISIDQNFELLKQGNSVEYLNEIALQDIPDDVSELYRKMLLRRRKTQQEKEEKEEKEEQFER